MKLMRNYDFSVFVAEENSSHDSKLEFSEDEETLITSLITLENPRIQVKIFDGIDIVHKFRGRGVYNIELRLLVLISVFKNTGLSLLFLMLLTILTLFLRNESLRTSKFMCTTDPMTF
jgi:hypothetical protein